MCVESFQVRVAGFRVRVESFWVEGLGLRGVGLKVWQSARFSDQRKNTFWLFNYGCGVEGLGLWHSS
jgi:hypothetical protein